MIFVSFQRYFDISESSLLSKNGDFDIWCSPTTFRYNFSLPVYAAPFQWRPLIFIRENLWRRVLKANKTQVSLKSYSVKIRIDSVNQILKNEEKVKQTRNINILTRITGWKVTCVYIHIYQIKKNWGPGPYNSLRHADNRKYFSDLSLMRNRREAHMFYLAREVGKFGDVLAEKKVTLSRLMNSNMVKPEKFHHLHLVYHFTVPLNIRNLNHAHFWTHNQKP